MNSRSCFLRQAEKSWQAIGREGLKRKEKNRASYRVEKGEKSDLIG